MLHAKYWRVISKMVLFTVQFFIVFKIFYTKRKRKKHFLKEYSKLKLAMIVQVPDLF